MANKNQKVLVINAGSSSIKWTLFTYDKLDVLATGLAERIGIDGNLEMKFNGKKVETKADLKNHALTVAAIIKLWQTHHVIDALEDISHIGFRVVQGGTYFNAATRLDAKAISLIKAAAKYAPLHNPGAILAIEAFQSLIPSAVLTASFDTSFHTSMPVENATYPIDYDLATKLGIKKYGMHGTSHHYITNKLARILKQKTVTFVNLHIGNGASLCAVKASKSFDTSMGLTPLAGVMMGTRSGDIDPSIIEFIQTETNMSVQEITNMLNKKSGLLGVSGISSDMRDVIQASKEGNARAKLAIALYAQRIADYAVVYINKLGLPLDGLVFTAGIGENSAFIRAEVLKRLTILPIKLDAAANEASYDEYKIITTPDSALPVYVIRTNEELMIATEAKAL